MPTQLNEALVDSLVLSDAYEWSLAPGGSLTLALSDQIVLSDAWQLLMINPATSTQGAWFMEIGERMVMSDHLFIPIARITQSAMELVFQPTDAKLRLTQAPVEVVMSPTDAHARITQVVIEVIAPHAQGTIVGAQIQIRIQ